MEYSESILCIGVSICSSAMFDFHVFGMLLSNINYFKKSPFGKLYRSLRFRRHEAFAVEY